MHIFSDKCDRHSSSMVVQHHDGCNGSGACGMYGSTDAQTVQQELQTKSSCMNNSGAHMDASYDPQLFVDRAWHGCTEHTAQCANAWSMLNRTAESKAMGFDLESGVSDMCNDSHWCEVNDSSGSASCAHHHDSRGDGDFGATNRAVNTALGLDNSCGSTSLISANIPHGSSTRSGVCVAAHHRGSVGRGKSGVHNKPRRQNGHRSSSSAASTSSKENNIFTGRVEESRRSGNTPCNLAAHPEQDPGGYQHQARSNILYCPSLRSSHRAVVGYHKYQQHAALPRQCPPQSPVGTQSPKVGSRNAAKTRTAANASRGSPDALTTHADGETATPTTTPTTAATATTATTTRATVTVATAAATAAATATTATATTTTTATATTTTTTGATASVANAAATATTTTAAVAGTQRETSGVTMRRWKETREWMDSYSSRDGHDFPPLDPPLELELEEKSTKVAAPKACRGSRVKLNCAKKGRKAM
eukprot:Lankesteria_metandrocarpae@DN88_c0_g1_i1.p1